jgi:hypothetical protein
MMDRKLMTPAVSETHKSTLVELAMKEEQIQHIVAEVLKRLLPRLGANGTRGTVIVVFTGATVGFTEAIQQLRSLILSGFRIQMVFSRAAEQLYSHVVVNQLAGFPHLVPLNASRWLSILKEARGVVVPLLSVNTLSKLSLLIADNLITNLILHGLFMGKPVIVAQNGADPAEHGRTELGFHKGRTTLALALRERLQVIVGYGCFLTDIDRLSVEVNAALEGAEDSHGRGPDLSAAAQRPALDHVTKMVTAADVLKAYRLGADLRLPSNVVITPLARDLAMKHGVCLLTA